MQAAFHRRMFGAVAVTKRRGRLSTPTAPHLLWVRPSPPFASPTLTRGPSVILQVSRQRRSCARITLTPHRARTTPSSRASLYQLELLLLQQSAPSDTVAVTSSFSPCSARVGMPQAFLQATRHLSKEQPASRHRRGAQRVRKGRMVKIEYRGSGVRLDL